MGGKTPEKRFTDKMKTFGEVLHGLDASNSNVRELIKLLPRLKPEGVTNEIKGDVTGTVIQIGSRLGGAWDEASKHVGEIGNRKLSQAYIEAAVAVGACRAGVHNRMDGNVTGIVIQTGDITKGINW